MLHIDNHNFYFDINLDKEKELKRFIEKNIKKFGQQEFEDYINTHFGQQY